MLVAEHFPHPHTAETIKDKIESVIKDYKLETKLVVFVTDYAAINVKLGHTSDYIRISWDAHGLHNMVMADGINR